MDTKTNCQNNEGKDILGVIAFGSLIGNIFQITSRKTLEQAYEALKAHASELNQHYVTLKQAYEAWKAHASELNQQYNNLKLRQGLVYNENRELKQANETLIAANNRLLKELMESREELIKLKGGSPEAAPARRRNPVTGHRHKARGIVKKEGHNE